MFGDNRIHVMIFSSNAAEQLLDQVANKASDLQKEVQHWNYRPIIDVLRNAVETLSAGPVDVALCIFVLQFAKWFDRLQTLRSPLDHPRLHAEMTRYSHVVQAHMDARLLYERGEPGPDGGPQTFDQLWALEVQLKN